MAVDLSKQKQYPKPFTSVSPGSDPSDFRDLAYQVEGPVKSPRRLRYQAKGRGVCRYSSIRNMFLEGEWRMGKFDVCVDSDLLALSTLELFWDCSTTKSKSAVRPMSASSHTSCGLILSRYPTFRLRV